MHSEPRFKDISLKACRYRLTFTVTEALHLPDYSGSMLRGIFGRALMQLSGITTADIQQKTPLFLYSPYAAVFEPQHQPTQHSGIISTLPSLPVPYVIEPPLHPARSYQPGEILQFHLVVIGEALEHLKTILLAWRRAFLQGVHPNQQGKASLKSVEACLDHQQNHQQSQLIFSEEQPVLLPHPTQATPATTEQTADVHLQLTTPLRIQADGHILNSEKITAAHLLRSLIRRVSLVQQLQTHQPNNPADIQQLNQRADTVQGHHQLHLHQWQRYSNRQQQSMSMNGLLGSWTLLQVPPALQSYLWLGQLLHIGKGTSFGLGGYKIQPAPTSTPQGSL